MDRERSQIGPVQTLQARVGLDVDLEIDLLTHSHLLKEALLRGQVQVGTFWKQNTYRSGISGKMSLFVCSFGDLPTDSAIQLEAS